MPASWVMLMDDRRAQRAEWPGSVCGASAEVNNFDERIGDKGQ